MALNQISMNPAKAPDHFYDTPPKPEQTWQDKLLLGLNIANGIAGIYDHVESGKQNSSKNELNKNELTNKQNNVLEAEKAANDIAAGARVYDQPTPGAGEFNQPNGLDDKGNPIYRKLYMSGKPSDGKAPTREVKLRNLDGTEDILIVPDVAGSSYKSAAEIPKVDPNRPFSDTTDLRKEYDNHPITKASNQLVSSYRKIDQAASNKNPTGATDISLIYNFMHMQDPTSTVREGEYASAENAGSVSQRVMNVYNSLLEGQKLEPVQRQNFANEAKSLLETQLEIQGDQDGRFSELAKGRNLKPSDVLDPTFEKYRKKFAESVSLVNKEIDTGTAYAAPSAKAPLTASQIADELLKRAMSGDPALKDYVRARN
tara:strand:- start:4869 stop:5984 length:1116 start_codon:yes stop_codon:yes gene_type:complete